MWARYKEEEEGLLRNMIVQFFRLGNWAFRFGLDRIREGALKPFNSASSLGADIPNRALLINSK